MARYINRTNGLCYTQFLCEALTMSFLSFFSFLTVTLVAALKCPQLRKSHATNCTMFYNCIELPHGGYVWIPAKCNDGLIFEPYLQMCVLSEDSNTCNGRITSPEIIVKKNCEKSSTVKSTWDINDSVQSGVTDQFSQNLDLSHLLNDDVVVKTERLKTDRQKGNVVIDSKNVTISINVLDESEGFYEFKEKCQKAVETLNLEKEKEINMSFLNNLIKKVSLYCQSGDSSEQRSNEKFTNIIQQLLTGRQSNISYCDTVILKCLSNNNTTQENWKKSSFDELSLADNSIIAIGDALGNKQYISRNKYLSLRDKLKMEFVNVIKCTEGIRLPNITDCTRYYFCDSRTATVTDFHCPINTAFNDQTRRCDQQTYKLCWDPKNLNEKQMHRSIDKKLPLNSSSVNHKNPCHSAGKIADSSSMKYYYFCYSNSENTSVNFVRLRCPKYLIFCRKTNSCTTIKLCNEQM